MTVSRTTQLFSEVLLSANPALRTSQLSLEVLMSLQTDLILGLNLGSNTYTGQSFQVVDKVIDTNLGAVTLSSQQHLILVNVIVSFSVGALELNTTANEILEDHMIQQSNFLVF